MSKKDKDFQKYLNKQSFKFLFFRILHIICYILSVLFIIAFIVAGVKGCQKQPQQKINNPSQLALKKQILKANSIEDYLEDYNFYYIEPYNPTFTGSFTNQLLEAFNFPTEAVQTQIGTDDYIEFPFEYPSFVINSATNEVSSANVLGFNFRVYASDFSTYIRFWRLAQIYLNNSDTYQPALSKSNNDADDLSYDTNSYAFLFSNDDVSQIPFFYSFFKLADKEDFTSFTFNQNFNYNAPLGVSKSSPYGSGVIGGVSQSSLFTKLVIDCGWFVSNSQLFDKIEVWYQLSDGSAFDFDGTIKQGPQSMWFYWCMYYVNSYSNTMIVVNSRNSSAYMPSNSSYGYYWQNSSTWSIDNYRYIDFLLPLSSTNKGRIEQFNNNNQTYYGGQIYGTTDVFSLLSMAFSSLLPFLSINILPSISIGVLLFLPAIVGIIVIIFNVLRK